jgi:hypothetical protein
MGTITASVKAAIAGAPITMRSFRSIGRSANQRINPPPGNAAKKHGRSKRGGQAAP